MLKRWWACVSLGCVCVCVGRGEQRQQRCSTAGALYTGPHSPCMLHPGYLHKAGVPHITAQQLLVFHLLAVCLSWCVCSLLLLLLSEVICGRFSAPARASFALIWLSERPC